MVFKQIHSHRNRLQQDLDQMQKLQSLAPAVIGFAVEGNKSLLTGFVFC